MAQLLKASEGHQREQAAAVQAGGGRIEPRIDHLGLGQVFAQCHLIGALVDQAAPGKFIENVSGGEVVGCHVVCYLKWSDLGSRELIQKEG
jgi:hypothetical protein